MKGCISTYKEDRGFGFIDAEDEQRYFLHVSELADGQSKRDLAQGVTVSFTPSVEERGLRARKIYLDDIDHDEGRRFSGEALLFDQSPEPPWALAASCPFRIVARSRSRETARSLLMARARLVGANALSHVHYRHSVWTGHEYTGSPIHVVADYLVHPTDDPSVDNLTNNAERLFADQIQEQKDWYELIFRRGILVLVPASLLLIFLSLPALVVLWLSAGITVFSSHDGLWLRRKADMT